MKFYTKAKIAVGTFLYSTIAINAFAQMPEWSYDAGPEMGDIPCHEQVVKSMGCELIDITASIPNMPEVSDKLMGRTQKFRPAFGPIPWRMRQEKNKVKILFMGQDGTHIAEAAGRPATAGFGGRAQDFANYFGVNEGAAFINAYSFTIKGQYGVYNTPYIFEKNGKKSIRTANLVSNQLWAMSNGLDSPITIWRNNLIDWIIRNNKESMKLIVLFGGASRDAIASFAKAKGAEVTSRYESQMENIQVPETKSEYAGGNNTFPSLLAKDGKDLYEKMLGKKLSYKDSKVQKEVVKHLKENLEEYMDKMVLTKGGPYKNGLLNPAQLGGYDLDTMIINGVKTRSLKGLPLNDGTVIENDIIVISLPHPSYLSRVVMDASSYSEGKENASKTVMKDVRKLDRYAKNGWEISPDLNKVNHYAEGRNYEYGRADIGPEFYDFGTPANRMVSKSTAKRMSGAPNVVIIGTRDNGNFPRATIKRMTEAKAAFGINPENLYIARPSAKEDRYVFDPGPGLEMAKAMVTSLDFDALYAEKLEVTCEEGGKEKSKTQVATDVQAESVKCESGEDKEIREMDFDKDGIAAFNIKSHPSVSDFGHYRGTFDNPEVIIIADPQGYDDIVTARALTGTRGQYLQSLMEDIGVKDKYLVIKTVPFAMDEASSSEWKQVLKITEKYRKNIMDKVLANGVPKLILTDGSNATMAMKELLADSKIPMVEIERKENAQDFGIAKAGKEIKKLRLFYKMIRSSRSGRSRLIKNYRLKISPRMENIPRSHLSFYSRVWEGTSGDRVITSKGTKYKGIAYAEVVPSWAYNQKAGLTQSSEKQIEKVIDLLREENFPLPYESIPSYIKRVE